MECTIRKALPDEAASLSHIAFQAKANWGYAQDRLELWTTEFLTVSAEYIENHHVWVACVDSVAVGFSGVRLHETEAELDHLWILPHYIRRGTGKQLFLYTAHRIREIGYPEMVFTSDRHADGFYRKLGAERIGDYYSVLQNTTLAKFKFAGVS